MTTERDIAAVLNEHHWDLSEWDVHKPLNRCTCGANVGNAPHEFTAHQAAMVMARLRKQGEEEPGIYSNLRRRIITTDWEQP